MIDHVNIVVSDLERSLHFYRDLLGFPEIRRARLEGDWIESIVGLKGVCADVVYVQPPGGGPRIELLSYVMPPGTSLPGTTIPNTVGLRHIAFRVDDIHAEYERLQNEGVQFVGPPTQVPPGAVKHDAGQKTLCYFRDPDGVILEFAEYG